LLRPSLSA